MYYAANLCFVFKFMITGGLVYSQMGFQSWPGCFHFDQDWLYNIAQKKTYPQKNQAGQGVVIMGQFYGTMWAKIRS